MEKQFLVSILMITHNHEKYVGEAIKSVLKQEIDGQVELIISNDASTDNTDRVIRDSINNIPDNFDVKYYSHEQNKGMVKNFCWVLSQFKGKFLALCEGDDYWIYTNKLAKQISFLRDNADYSICCHRVKVLNNNGVLASDENMSLVENSYDIGDLAEKNLISTPSVVYRSDFNLNIPDFLANSNVGDYWLHMLFAERGKIKYFPEEMAVYRTHSTSSWSSIDHVKRLAKWASVILDIEKYFSVGANHNPRIYTGLKNQLVSTTNKLRNFCLMENRSGEYVEFITKQMNNSFFKSVWLKEIYPAELSQKGIELIGVKRTFRRLIQLIRYKLFKV